MCDKHNKKFVQLHAHTDFSLLDGASSIKKIVAKAKEFGHPALAITDHANPAGLFDFYKECKKNSIKPILGLEFYITNDLRGRKSHKERETVEDRDYHQSVYIKNKEGYVNYNYLTYMAHTEGYYYKPRIDFDLLFEKKKGLMITSSCMASKIGNYIRLGLHKEAETLFRKYSLEFGEDFYGEIQFNEVKGQKEINDFIIHMSNRYNIPLIIGGDVHYAEKSDNELQDALIRSKRDNEVDWVIDARNLYFHDASDYFDFNKKFGYNYSEKLIDTCLENSIKFSEKVNFDFELGTYHLPKINTGDLDSKKFLEKVTWEGIIKNINTERKYFPEKYSNEEITKIEQQVDYELKVIDDLGLNDYMLIVQDIINWEKSNGIFVGPGRGSAAGSAVAWGCGITGLNPIEHGLYFERFINPNRKCLTENNFVLLKNGEKKNISEIEINNDFPQTPKGLGNLIQIHKRELEINEKVFEIELIDGTKIELTSNHIVPVLRNNKIIEIPTKDILETDELIIF